MEKLIRGCRRLERTAQREMFKELTPYLFAIAMRYADGVDDAKDILQESFILIFNNIEKCKATHAPGFKAWCKRIVVNSALLRARKKGVQIKVLNVVKEQRKSYSEPKITNRLNAEDITKLLGTLPSNQRLVFNLVIVDGFSHKEVAEELNIKESYSRTLLTRARKKMQELIAEDNTFLKKSINL